MAFHGLIAHFFLVTNNVPLFGLGHSLFIHSPTAKHLGHFQALTIMNKATINIHVRNLCGQICSNPLDTHQGARLLDHRVRVCLVL